MLILPSGTDLKLQNAYERTKGTTIVHKTRAYIPRLNNPVRYEVESSPSEKALIYPSDITRNSEDRVRIVLTEVQQSTFADTKLGEVLRRTKTKFGKRPFIEAYKRAQATSKEINDRRRKFLEEEIKYNAVLRAGDD